MAVLCPSFAIGNCPIRMKHGREESITTATICEHRGVRNNSLSHVDPSSKFNLTFQIPPPPAHISFFVLSDHFSFFFCLSLSLFRLSSWSARSGFDVSLMVISMEKKRVHGVWFTREEKFSTMNSDRFSSYPFLCPPANCFFPSIPRCKANRNGAARRCFVRGVFHKRDIKNGGKGLRLEPVAFY